MKLRNLVAVSLLAMALLLGAGLVFSRVRHKRAGATLVEAAQYQCTDEALSLIEGGADVNTREPRFGDTALLEAAAAGNDALVLSLLQHGAQVNARNNLGMTALTHAAMRGQPSTVQLLLEHGANPRLRNHLGRMPSEDAAPYLKLRHLSPRERAAYPQVVAILQAAEAKAAR